MLKKKRQHNEIMPVNWEFLRNKILVILFSDHPNLNKTIVTLRNVKYSSQQHCYTVSTSFYFNFQAALWCMTRFSVGVEQDGCRWNKVLCYFLCLFLFVLTIFIFTLLLLHLWLFNFKTFQVNECRNLLTSAAYWQSCTRKCISLFFASQWPKLKLTSAKDTVRWKRLIADLFTPAIISLSVIHKAGRWRCAPCPLWLLLIFKKRSPQIEFNKSVASLWSSYSVYCLLWVSCASIQRVQEADGE